MKILAGSLERAADTFLHAGYISAYPRPYYPHSYGSSPTKIEMDMLDALRLKGEVLASSAQLPDGIVAAATTSGGGWSMPQLMLMGLGLAGLGVALAMSWRAGTGKQRWSALVPGLAGLLLLVLGPSCGENLEPLPTVPPWQGQKVQIYENPELATKALLHGVIADALMNIGRDDVTSLANLQNEVGLPLAAPGKGVAYALTHYGQDGWGKEMRLTRQGGQYLVTSAGKDGVFGGADDLKLHIGGCDDSSWDEKRYGHFIRKDGAEVVLLIHRWTGDHFKYNDQARARRLTGGDLFDAIAQSKISADGKTMAQKALASAAAKGKHQPLVLQVF